MRRPWPTGGGSRQKQTNNKQNSFLLENESIPWPYCGRRDYVNESFRLVAQCLTQLRHHLPPLKYCNAFVFSVRQCERSAVSGSPGASKRRKVFTGRHRVTACRLCINCLYQTSRYADRAVPDQSLCRQNCTRPVAMSTELYQTSRYSDRTVPDQSL